MVVPLKKQRTGKFLKPWDDPDEMNLEEVRQEKERKEAFPLFSTCSGRTGKKTHLGQFRGQGELEMRPTD